MPSRSPEHDDDFAAFSILLHVCAQALGIPDAGVAFIAGMVLVTLTMDTGGAIGTSICTFYLHS